VKDDLVWLIWSSNTGVRGEAYNAMSRSFAERFPNVTATQAYRGGAVRRHLREADHLHRRGNWLTW
jgi:hypothetical protein